MKRLNLASIRFGGMRQEVSQALKKAIFDGHFEPGQQIYEAELAKMFHLSRGPIREALLQLEKESLVRSVFNKGWFVIELTPRQITEILNLRAVLEVLALRLAKMRIKNKELKRLKIIQSDMLAKYEENKIDEAIQGDFLFHQELWRFSGHSLLQATLINNTTPYFAFFKVARLRKLLEVTAFHQGLKNHQGMIDFLEGSTERSAEGCIRHHLKSIATANWSSLLDMIHREEQEIQAHDQAPPAKRT